MPGIKRATATFLLENMNFDDDLSLAAYHLSFRQSHALGDLLLQLIILLTSSLRKMMPWRALLTSIHVSG
eukprot:SAG31_NODE_2582_length_5436_cov_1.573356_9_plen_70_part_00